MADFRPLLNRLSERGIRPNSAAAREWFSKKIRESSVINRRTLLSDSERKAATPQIGKMYFYNYDPKFKDKLPYYDEFPLIFVIDYFSGGFMGINLHYVSPRNRMEIMESLSGIATNKRYDASTRLALSYKVLRGVSKFSTMKPCIKKYLFSNVKSSFVTINANEWDIAIFLPVQKFRKANASKVWSDSSRMQ
jgi:hypothetical protein